MPNFNQFFRSTDLNAPPVYGAAGSAILVLNAALVNGYNDNGIAITGITRSGSTATATCAAADILRLQTGHILTISGAGQADYNITATITVASTTTFTYTVANSPTTPATGTITFSKKLPITSAVESGATITATLTNANTTLVTGDYVTVAGLSPAGANGTFQITVNSSTSISYTGPGGLGTITGTGTYHKAGLGWTSPYTGTNLAAYLPKAVTGCPQFYLRVSDNALTAGGAKECAALGLETMSDVNTGTGKFPTTAQVALSGTETVGGVCWRKSATADSTTARAWSLGGDGATFYFNINSEASASTGRYAQGFGAFTSYKASDAYNSLISGPSTFNSATVGNSSCGFSANLYGTVLSGLYAARSYSQTGGSQALWNALSALGSSGQVAGGANGGVLTYPMPVDSALWVVPNSMGEGSAATQIRGRMRGLYYPAHTTNPFASEFDTATNVAGLSGVTLVCVLHSSNSTAGSHLIDRFGPW